MSDEQLVISGNEIDWIGFLLCYYVWHGSVMVRAFGFAISWFTSQSFCFHGATLSSWFTHVPWSPSNVIFATGEKAVLLCGCEGIPESGVSQPLRH